MVRCTVRQYGCIRCGITGRYGLGALHVPWVRGRRAGHFVQDVTRCKLGATGITASQRSLCQVPSRVSESQQQGLLRQSGSALGQLYWLKCPGVRVQRGLNTGALTLLPLSGDNETQDAPCISATRGRWTLASQLPGWDCSPTPHSQGSCISSAGQHASVQILAQPL